MINMIIAIVLLFVVLPFTGLGSQSTGYKEVTSNPSPKPVKGDTWGTAVPCKNEKK